jgi:chloramphenicol 3-O-phosphotransferase
MGSIIVLSGPVGAGKTTVGKALMQGLAAPAAYIEGDKFWGFIPKPKPDRRADFKAIMRAMFRASGALAAEGYQVVLDFSVPTWFLGPAAARLADADLHFVVLRPALDVCVKRAAGRQEGRIEDYRPYRELYDLFEVADRHIVANDDLAPLDAAEMIHAGLAEGRFRFP